MTNTMKDYSLPDLALPLKRLDAQHSLSPRLSGPGAAGRVQADLTTVAVMVGARRR